MFRDYGQIVILVSGLIYYWKILQRFFSKNSGVEIKVYYENFCKILEKYRCYRIEIKTFSEIFHQYCKNLLKCRTLIFSNVFSGLDLHLYWIWAPTGLFQDFAKTVFFLFLYFLNLETNINIFKEHLRRYFCIYFRVFWRKNII